MTKDEARRTMQQIVEVIDNAESYDSRLASDLVDELGEVEDWLLAEGRDDLAEQLVEDVIVALRGIYRGDSTFRETNAGSDLEHLIGKI